MRSIERSFISTLDTDLDWTQAWDYFYQFAFEPIDITALSNDMIYLLLGSG